VHLKYPLWKIIAHTVIFNKPTMLQSYLRERRAN
jgi:hypothetical protein